MLNSCELFSHSVKLLSRLVSGSLLGISVVGRAGLVNVSVSDMPRVEKRLVLVNKLAACTPSDYCCASSRDLSGTFPQSFPPPLRTAGSAVTMTDRHSSQLVLIAQNGVLVKLKV